MSLCLWVWLEVAVRGFVGGADGAASYGTSAMVDIVDLGFGAWLTKSLPTNKQPLTKLQ